MLGSSKALLLVGILLAVPTGGLATVAQADEDAGREIGRILEEARRHELTAGDVAAARQLYESLLLPDRIGKLSAAERGDALAGVARCLKAAGDSAGAEEIWRRILADPELDAAVHAYARAERDAWLAASQPTAEEVAERLRAERLAEEVRRARVLFGQARAALDRMDYDDALALAFEARVLDRSNERIAALIDEIQAARPDPSRLLPQLVSFVNTRVFAERMHVRQEVDEALKVGRDAEARGHLEEAARRFVDAIRRIDASGFLEVGIARGHASLLERRQRAVALLEQVHAKASEAGIEGMPSAPALPPPDERTPGIEGQLYGLLANLFRAGGDVSDELRFYDLGSPRKGRRPSLASQFPGSTVSQDDGTLTRAAWVEARIESEMGGTWLDPLAPDFDERADRGSRSGRPARLLARFGDVVAVQHQEALHRRVRALIDSFDVAPPPMRVDVHLFAATSAGVVRVAEALELRSTPGAEGFSLIQRFELTDASVARVAAIEGVEALGHARLVFRDGATTRLRIEQRTAEHPMFVGLGAPALTVPPEVATYGLSLDLYVEDLPHAASGLTRSAVGLVATTRMPTHTTIVPRLAEGLDRFQRLPRMGGHDVRAIVELPHFGSLVVLGLPNPFPASQQERHELVLLIGAQRDDDPLPDTPPPGVDPRVVPPGWTYEELALGPLGAIDDEVVRDGWPEWAPADPPTAWERRDARDRYLERLLTRIARLASEDGASEGRMPVSVHEGTVAATLESPEHVRLARAVARLRDRERDLYAIDVSTVVVPQEVAARWQTLEGVRRAPAGALRLGAEAAASVASDFGRVGEGDALDRMARASLAFATQQVVVRNVQEHNVVRDVEISTGEGAAPPLPRLDRVAQGVLVEVRPGLEDATGVRDVAVRVRAARWDAIERRSVPGLDDTSPLRLDLVRWHRVGGAVASERADTDVVSDDDALLVTVPRPGLSDRLLAVLVRVRRVR